MQINHLPIPSARTSLRLEGNPADYPELAKNEVVEGKVVRSLSADSAVLLIKGKRVIARTGMPLTEGSRLSLRVDGMSPVPKLTPLGVRQSAPGPVNLSVVLSALEADYWGSALRDIEASGLSERDTRLIRELMRGLSSQSLTRATPESLRTLIASSGLSWEAKLRNALLHKSFDAQSLRAMAEGDLKGFASRCLMLPEQEGGGLGRIVSALQNIQLLDHFALEQDRKIYIQLPVEFPDGFLAVAQLLIGLPREEAGEPTGREKDESATRIVFLLELSRLGPVRAELAVRDRMIEGAFLVATSQTRSLIEKNLFLLTEALEKKGFHIRHLVCHLRDPESVKQPPVTEILGRDGSTMDLLV